MQYMALLERLSSERLSSGRRNVFRLGYHLHVILYCKNFFIFLFVLALLRIHSIIALNSDSVSTPFS